tara:strand:+ start:116 stop:352 length:237 start_codon:yes stop_codon:yes gene_type:complete
LNIVLRAHLSPCLEFKQEEFILDARKTPGAGDSLEEKKHRMVCYFFEKLFDLMMGIHQNLSSNPGFECFVGKWGGGRT